MIMNITQWLLKKKNIIIISFLFIILFYQFYDYNQKVNILNNNILSLNEKINAQDVLLNNKISNVENNLKENKQDLLNLIQATQSENQQQLNELKENVEESIQSIKVESADFSAIVNDVLKSVVSVITNLGQGSGVFFRTSGYIVTNYHVIKDASTIYVYTYDKKTYNVEVIGYDSEKDIALIKINVQYPHLQTEDSDNIQVGERVIALGNPGGLDFSVTEGIVSAVNRVVSSNNIGYVQTDVPISPGNSGGPLVNKRGKIIGINNFKISGEGFEGLGFAIPSNVINEAVNKIID